MLNLLKNGLPKTLSPKKIAVIGAGMAGLTAADLLEKAGHEVILLEADNNVGGRIKTLRSPFSRGLLAEAGAMRIPENHTLTHTLIEKYKLRKTIFPTVSNNGLFYIKNKKFSREEYKKCPSIYNSNLLEEEKNKTIDQLFDEAIEKAINDCKTEDIDLIADKYDKYSLYSYLKHRIGYSDSCIEMMGIVLNNESLMNTSLIECIRDHLDLNKDRKLYEIEGGMDNLPKAMLKNYQGKIFLNSLVNAIYQDNKKVIISCKDNGYNQQIWVDYLVVTIPFTMLRHIDVFPLFSTPKVQAIRQLHYSNSTKIFVEFRKSFWEEQGIGGSTITDLPLRTIYYLQKHGEKQNSILLASYTWGADSLKWEGLSTEETQKLVLAYLSKIHGNAVYREVVNTVVYSWLQSPYAKGAFAHFEPEQQTRFHKHIQRPEGRVYLAGEHTSLKHGWIEGAVESGIKVAQDVNNKINQNESSQAIQIDQDNKAIHI